jgi:ABC-type nickel/cobalt efflux system permease component RcnA
MQAGQKVVVRFRPYMAPSIVAVLAIGGLLGLRHAFEPDHLAAVSTLATRPGGTRIWTAARLGLVWGIGHTATVGVVALLVIALGVRLPPRLWPAAELLVAALLVWLGGKVIWRYARGRWHMHAHTHVAAEIGGAPHFHLHSHAHAADHLHGHGTVDARRSLGFGIAHGLAGSGAIIALLLAAVPDAPSRVAYFAAFGAGTIVGMLAVSFTLSVLVRMAAERGARWATLLHVGAAVASVVAGVALAQQVIFRP